MVFKVFDSSDGKPLFPRLGVEREAWARNV
jgi:hypothetical protein